MTPHDLTAPHPVPQRPFATTPARLYAAAHGGPEGRDAYPPDQELVDRLADLGLDPRLIAHHNRDFHTRAVTWAAHVLGVGQFVDIGCGLPAQSRPDTHTTVAAAHPSWRVLHVDNDPVVRAHADALLRTSTPGASTVLEADLRDPAVILDRAREVMDFGEPVAVMLLGVLHCLTDADRPHDIVRHLVDALPPGSCLLLSHTTNDYAPRAMERAEELLAREGIQAQARSRESVIRFFDGLIPDGPGLVPVHQWRPADPASAALPASRIHTYGGIGTKPPPTAKDLSSGDSGRGAEGRGGRA
ncbi:SAM-dependent methyltransferase [Streptomyces uncialis]|uniref:SAM-dependent methyltransferase n=1 Tax=Streptomyces uncialis TaxID=1048205 RepID=UPI0037F80EEF